MPSGYPAKIIDGKKQCSHCKAWKLLDDFGFAKKNGSRLFYKAWCKACLAKAGKERYKKREVKIKTREHAKNWKRLHPERYRQLQRNYEKRNKKIVAQRKKDDNERRKNALTDSYLRNVIRSNMGKIDITPEMLELKRDQIALCRELRKIKKEILDGTS